ncbi:polysaccharide pyruvyl transferase family protein [Shewanella algae]|uniref:polysaccharide pyruvyl transferase family protein n=1 Tax=Shewanella algae TaxID=38313 RepID=UPI0016427FA1|nr:polysaccharide pyruvyl transferase family protein [Shewanella algae]MBO2644926.1 polysaccharide pyruvyl transferase family protein [Shewanella algae]TVL14812.1 hypothetical protein AYJ02_12170 [Shewanella algae]WKC43255.1 polysaccharide pyruvyl transferase family protein [Shewanella algae]
MKIALLWHTPNSDNLGVSALAIANLTLINKALKELDIKHEFVFVGTAGSKGMEVIRELSSALSVDISFEKYSLKGIVAKLARLDRSGLNIFSDFDYVFDIGEGDSFTDIYGFKRLLNMTLSKLHVVYSGSNLVLSPQTIGPFESWISRKLGNFCIGKAKKVFVRDNLSAEYLEKNSIDYTLTTDVAFELPFDKLDRVSQRKTVGLNVSGLLYSGGYSQNNQFGLKFDYAEFIDKLVVELIEKDYEVILVPHVTPMSIPYEDDHAASLVVSRKFNLEIPDRFETPMDAKSFMSGLDFVIAARMHAAIGALSSGTPVVPISYSRKFIGVFGHIGYDYVLDPRTLELEDIISKIISHLQSTQICKDAMCAVKNAKALNHNYFEELKQLLK